MKMPGTLEDSGLDPSELRFRLDSVQAGVWITFVVCAAAFGYVLGWERPHETAQLVLIALAAVGGGLVLVLPWQAIIRSRWREGAFSSWSLLDLGIIIALAALDGGGSSPMVALIVIPIVFTALSYPRWLVVVISVATVTGYLVLAVATSTPGHVTLMIATTITCTSLMCNWQAANHDRRRELLAIASQTDPLTGALNRRGFQRAADAMVAAVSRLGHPASLVLLDLDKFKEFNDTHGHAAGDDLLCWTVERIRGSLRPTDSLARLGGDEFAILLAGADRGAAEAAVARITEDLAARVGTSFGIAAAPADGADIETLYRQADADLYDVKRSGAI